jgi:hypothetical protein
VRRYSSDDPPEVVDEKDVNVPMYWLRPSRTLPATKGMHRFVWDLRYPAPGAVSREMPISAIYKDTPREPLGVLAVPATYMVKLTAGGMTFTQPLRLRMDPRATITAVGLGQQFTLATKIADLMNRTFAALASPGVPAPLKAELTNLNGDLATAYEAIEGADRAPTVAAQRTAGELERRAQRLLK